jgi:hypothetical protein
MSCATPQSRVSSGPTVQRIGGRKTLAMVLRYTLDGRRIDEAIRASERALSAAGRGENHSANMITWNYTFSQNRSPARKSL